MKLEAENSNEAQNQPLLIADVISSSKNYKWVRGYYFKALLAGWIVGAIIAYIFRDYL